MSERQGASAQASRRRDAVPRTEGRPRRLCSAHTKYGAQIHALLIRCARLPSSMRGRTVWLPRTWRLSAGLWPRHAY
eukprot:scaffold244126_cov30-Tisochrysis_lutea.AAC.9